MIMPSKVTKPVDSLVSIGSVVLSIIGKGSMSLDDLHEKLNQEYYKSIPIERLILCLDFLFLINKVERDNEIITIKI